VRLTIRRVLLLASLATLLRAAPARARQPDPDEDSPPSTTGQAADHARPILGFSVTGKLIDPADRINQVIEGLLGAQPRFVESGPADLIGTPIGTVPRVRDLMARLGYDAVVEPREEVAGIRLHIDLRPFDRVRHIFVDGNWPLRQDEVQRRLIEFRPGLPLPLPGPEREAAIERERVRVREFLRGEGYMGADVRIEMRPHGLFESIPSLSRLASTPSVEPASTDIQVSVSRGPGYPIGALRVTGNTAVPTDDITKVFRHYKWWSFNSVPKPFKQQVLREDVGIVTQRYRDEGYAGARVSTDYDPATSINRKTKSLSLGVTIAERKRISVAFEGNRRSASSLMDQVTLFERGAYDDYEVQASADAIQHYYQGKGHFLARVQWRRERLSPDADRIVFLVDEGPELRVRQVEMVGNRVLSSDELREVVTVREFPLLGLIGLGTGGHVTGRQIQLDAERLVEHYRANGFPDAKARGAAATSRDAIGLVGAVAAAAETVSRARDDIYVRFSIEEGPRVYVQAVVFESADGAPLPRDQDFLRKSVQLQPGDPMRPGVLEDDGRRLTRLLADEGYPAVAVEPDVDRQGDRVAVVWRVRSGPRTRVGPIFIRGNFFTLPQTILEQIPVRSGGVLTTTGVERGKRNLALLQLFNLLRITFPGQEAGREVVPMVIDVEERHDHWGIPSIGVGISTEQAAPDSGLCLLSTCVGAYGSAGYVHRNLLGRGWTLSGRGDLGNSLARATALFSDRRFFGTLFRLEVSGNYLSQATVRLGDIRQWGGSIGFARQMLPGVDAAVRYNLRNTTRTESLLRGAGPDHQRRSVELATTVGSVSASIEWLRLDSLVLPTRGFRLEGIAELALPNLSFGIGRDRFIKVGGRSLVVMPVARWLSVRHGVRIDQGFPLGGASLLPKVERFFAGGDTTIRGFQIDRARTETIRFPLAPGLESVQFRPLGGSLRVLHNIDFQVPLAPPLWGAVFMDSGVVADSLDSLDPSQFRHGVGVGLLVKLPVGDIALSWAWPLDPDLGDARRGRLHVNLGLMY